MSLLKPAILYPCATTLIFHMFRTLVCFKGHFCIYAVQGLYNKWLYQFIFRFKLMKINVLYDKMICYVSETIIYLIQYQLRWCIEKQLSIIFIRFIHVTVLMMLVSVIV
ncbi:hypothetical protein ACJX0J_011928, partial [Zea mays]